jgi:hypothetical protein
MKKIGTRPGKSATMTGAALCGAALGMIFAVTSVQAADPMNGERLAQRWCAACHVVASNQRQAYADAPPFEEIAKREFQRVGTDNVPARSPRKNAEHELESHRSRRHRGLRSSPAIDRPWQRAGCGRCFASNRQRA